MHTDRCYLRDGTCLRIDRNADWSGYCYVRHLNSAERGRDVNVPGWLGRILFDLASGLSEHDEESRLVANRTIIFLSDLRSGDLPVDVQREHLALISAWFSLVGKPL